MTHSIAAAATASTLEFRYGRHINLLNSHVKNFQFREIKYSVRPSMAKRGKEALDGFQFSRNADSNKLFWLSKRQRRVQPLSMHDNSSIIHWTNGCPTTWSIPFHWLALKRAISHCCFTRSLPASRKGFSFHFPPAPTSRSIRYEREIMIENKTQSAMSKINRNPARKRWESDATS